MSIVYLFANLGILAAVLAINFEFIEPHACVLAIEALVTVNALSVACMIRRLQK